MSAQPRSTRPEHTAPRIEAVAGAEADESSAAARVLATIALASLGAAAIHVAAAITEAGEGIPTLVFFVAVAAAQAVWGLRSLAGATRVWLLLGAAGNLAVLIVWVASRTVGLPVGAAADVAVPVGVPDAIAAALQGIVVIGALALAARTRRVARAGARAPVFATIAALVMLGAAVVGVLVELGVVEGLASAS